MPTIVDTFFHFPMKRSIVAYFDTFPSVYNRNFDRNTVCFCNDTLHINEGTTFLQCQTIIDTYLLLMRDIICIPFVGFTPDHILSYIKVMNQRHMHVALLYITADGRVYKKFRPSIILHLCGSKNEVRLGTDFCSPLNCNVPVTATEFNIISSNHKFGKNLAKKFHLSFRCFRDFICMVGYIQTDLDGATNEAHRLLGVHALPPPTLPRPLPLPLPHPLQPMLGLQFPPNWVNFEDDST